MNPVFIIAVIFPGTLLEGAANFGLQLAASVELADGRIAAWCANPPNDMVGETYATEAAARAVYPALPVLPRFAGQEEPTAEEVAAALQKQCGDYSQARLDGLAQAWGYDNITTLRSAVLSSVPHFHAEGVAGQAAWDDEWSAAQSFIAAVMGGTVAPTFEAYQAAMPALPARPV